jgi:hypothetical protein
VSRCRSFAGRRSLVEGKVCYLAVASPSSNHKLSLPTDITRGSPCLSPDVSSANHAQTVSPHSAVSPGPYENMAVRACVFISELRNKHQIPVHPPVIAFPISSYGGRPVSSSINVRPYDRLCRCAFGALRRQGPSNSACPRRL